MSTCQPYELNITNSVKKQEMKPTYHHFLTPKKRVPPKTYLNHIYMYIHMSFYLIKK